MGNYGPQVSTTILLYYYYTTTLLFYYNSTIILLYVTDVSHSNLQTRAMGWVLIWWGRALAPKRVCGYGRAQHLAPVWGGRTWGPAVSFTLPYLTRTARPALR